MKQIHQGETAHPHKNPTKKTHPPINHPKKEETTMPKTTRSIICIKPITAVFAPILASIFILASILILSTPITTSAHEMPLQASASFSLSDENTNSLVIWSDGSATDMINETILSQASSIYPSIHPSNQSPTPTSRWTSLQILPDICETMHGSFMTYADFAAVLVRLTGSSMPDIYSHVMLANLPILYIEAVEILHWALNLDIAEALYENGTAGSAASNTATDALGSITSNTATDAPSSITSNTAIDATAPYIHENPKITNHPAYTDSVQNPVLRSRQNQHGFHPRSRSELQDFHRNPYRSLTFNDLAYMLDSMICLYVTDSQLTRAYLTERGFTAANPPRNILVNLNDRRFPIGAIWIDGITLPNSSNIIIIPENLGFASFVYINRARIGGHITITDHGELYGFRSSYYFVRGKAGTDFIHAAAPNYRAFAGICTTYLAQHLRFYYRQYHYQFTNSFLHIHKLITSKLNNQ